MTHPTRDDALRALDRVGFKLPDYGPFDDASQRDWDLIILRAFIKKQNNNEGQYRLGEFVRKKGDKGQWHGNIVGFYSTDCTPYGYAIESVYEANSVQIYPESALEPWEPDTITIAREDVPEGLVEANRWYTSALLHKISADLTCPSPKENLEILLKTSALVAKEARK